MCVAIRFKLSNHYTDKYIKFTANIIFPDLIIKRFKMSDQESLDNSETVINLKLFKQLRLYQLFDPSTRKIFNFNIYQLILILILFVYVCIIIFGLSGYIVGTKITPDNISESLILCTHIVNIVTLLKAINFLYKANDIWELFNVTRINFLTSRHCRKYINNHKKYQKLSSKIVNCIITMTIISGVIWTTFPLVLYAKSFGDLNAVERFENILNYRFPVTISTYNKYFILFYIMELIITMIVAFLQINFTIYIVSFSFVIVAQYKIIALAFASIGYDDQMTRIDDGRLD